MENKKTAVFGIYTTTNQAEAAVNQLMSQGFSGDDISVLMEDSNSSRQFAHEKNTKVPEGTTTGATAGGVIGAAAALSGRRSLSRAIVQIRGDCLVSEIEPLRKLLDECPNMRSLIGAHEQALFAQAQQSAACNATHVIESRFARWLLRATDLCGSDELPLTQEYIAQMLGVRRTSVTLVARTLQKAELIRYARGHIKIIDKAALRDTACECYQTVKMNYSNILLRTND